MIEKEDIDRQFAALREEVAGVRAAAERAAENASDSYKAETTPASRKWLGASIFLNVVLLVAVTLMGLGA